MSFLNELSHVIYLTTQESIVNGDFSNVSQLGILGESNCSTSLNRSALETETPNHVTDLKRRPAFHHRKNHLLNNKVARIC